MRKKEKLLKRSPFTVGVLIVTLLFSMSVIMFALLLNYSNLVEYSRQTGYGNFKSMLWPALIDIGLLVALLNVIVIDLRNWRRGKLYTWGLVIFFSLLTVIFNVQHAGTTSTAKLFVNVLPAILIVLLMELMRIVILNVANDNVENATIKKSLMQDDTKIVNDVTKVPDNATDRKALAIKLHQDGTTDLLEIAVKVGVKDVRTVKSYLKDII